MAMSLIPIKEGKTKIIRENVLSEEKLVYLESKDNLTAGNGERNIIIKDKGKITNDTACNVFEFLNENGVLTHYIRRIDDDIFEAYECDMIPIEIVVRRIADGSYLKRNLDSKKGDIFSKLTVEFFYKDDKLGDPLIIIKEKEDIISESYKTIGVCGLEHTVNVSYPLTKKLWNLYSPETNELISSIDPICRLDEIEYIRNQAKFIFLLLEKAFRNLGIVLWDLKLKFGYILFANDASENRENKIVLANIVDNDSWRITLDGVNLDKQRFRDGTASEEQIRENYIFVRDMTSKFSDMADKGNNLYFPKLYFITDDSGDVFEMKKILFCYEFYNYYICVLKDFNDYPEGFRKIFMNNFESSVIICKNNLLYCSELEYAAKNINHPIIYYPKTHNFYRRESGVKDAVKEALRYVAQVNPLVYAKTRMEFEENL